VTPAIALLLLPPPSLSLSLSLLASREKLIIYQYGWDFQRTCFFFLSPYATRPHVRQSERERGGGGEGRNATDYDRGYRMPRDYLGFSAGAMLRSG